MPEQENSFCILKNIRIFDNRLVLKNCAAICIVVCAKSPLVTLEKFELNAATAIYHGPLSVFLFQYERRDSTIYLWY